MKTKSLSIFLVALFVVEMNLGAEEGNNGNKEDEKFEYKIMKDNPPTYNFILKTVLIGDDNVGKSVLIRKICNNEPFSKEYSSTVGFDSFILYFKIVSDVLKCQIWDCCGMEAYRNSFAYFYGNARVFLLVYDVTNEKSFKDIEYWVNDVKTNNKDKTIHFVLIGNKIDLENARVVSKEKGENFAKENGMAFVEVSAKTDAGREDLENILAKIIYEEFKKDKEPKKKEENENDEEKEVEDKNDEKSNEINLGDENEGDFGGEKEHTHSSSLCDWCKEICDNC